MMELGEKLKSHRENKGFSQVFELKSLMFQDNLFQNGK